jgi:hypothetical protein
MKRGAFVLARRAARPIVCATIRGARNCLARGDVAVKPGAIEIELSAPFSDEPLEDRVVTTFEEALARRPRASPI